MKPCKCEIHIDDQGRELFILIVLFDVYNTTCVYHKMAFLKYREWNEVLVSTWMIFDKFLYSSGYQRNGFFMQMPIIGIP